MDFVDLDKVLDEFEEEEKQALSIVPGQELRPSGYLEFLEKHQEQDWALIHPDKLPATSGYTLERQSAREPSNVAYDDPYDSFSAYKLSFMTGTRHGSLSTQNSYDRLPQTRRNHSAIVTSLTRLSSFGDDVNTVYTATTNCTERKGIANCTERKGTIAYHSAEVQTDALSPTSEQELMSSPFPKSDIIVDGHGDTTVSNEQTIETTYYNEMNRNYTHDDAGITALDKTNTETHQSFSSTTEFSKPNKTQKPASRFFEGIDTASSSALQFNFQSSVVTSCEESSSFPLSQRLDTTPISETQSNLHSSAVNLYKVSTGYQLQERRVGFHDSSEEVVDDSEVNMYLYQINEQTTSEMLLHTNLFSLDPQNTSAGVPNVQHNVDHGKDGREYQFLANEHRVPESEIDNYFTSTQESLPEKHHGDVEPACSGGEFYCHDPDIVADVGVCLHLQEVIQHSDRLRHLDGVSYAENNDVSVPHNELAAEDILNVEFNGLSISHDEPGDLNVFHGEPSDINISHDEPSNINISHDEPSNINISHVEPSDINISYVEPSDINISYVEPRDKNILYTEPGDTNVSQVDPTDRQILYNSLINGKLEIETILDDMKKSEPIYSNVSDNLLQEKIEIENLLRKMGNEAVMSNTISEHLLQGRMEIEHILDEVILKQYSELELPSVQLSEDSDFLRCTHPKVESAPGSVEDRPYEFLFSGSGSQSWSSSSQSIEMGSQALLVGVGARPKDPSGIKKNRPSSLMGLSKVSLDLPTKTMPGMENASVDTQTVSTTDVLFVNAAEQSQQILCSKLPDDNIPDSPTVSDARLRSDPADLVESGSKHVIRDFSQPFNHIQNGQGNDKSLVSTDKLEDSLCTGSQKLKRPTSLNLPVRPEVNEGDEDEENVTHEAPPNAAEKAEDGAPPVRPGTDLTVSSVTQHDPGIFVNLGHVAPFWIPDADAQACMICQIKFTVWKRRHHCRACGKVLCAGCCNQKAVLPYMDQKEARVCVECHIHLSLVPGASVNLANPNSNEYSSRVALNQQASSHANPPTILVPAGVLKNSGNQKHFSEPKQVVFSDGIRPGVDLSDLDDPELSWSSQDLIRTSQQQQNAPRTLKLREDSLARSQSLIPGEGLPHLLGLQSETGCEKTGDTFNWTDYKPDEGPQVMYALNRNLLVGVKIINLDCCMNRVSWCFVTRGMNTAGQSELVVLVELLEEELASASLSPPRETFLHFQEIYEEALKGTTFHEMGHFVFHHSHVKDHDHCGFLFVQPTFQCLVKIPVPECPYLFGVLIQKWELPWARVFPLRLMLRLGAEFRYYPCPLISMRNRKPVFFEIGHTIISLLADFHNFQYTLPQIRGLTIQMESKKTTISFPRNRYNDIMKVLRNSNEHVMAMGSSFSSEVDSHLVCIQSEDGNYQTQAVSIQDKPRLVTGACFVVFNGALKLSSGLHGKSSIVEDGLMVQVLPEVLAGIKEAMKNMSDYVIRCGPVEAAVSDEMVELRWVDNDINFNIGVKSYIDSSSLQGIEMIGVKCPTDYLGENLVIRWTQVYLLQIHDEHVGETDSMEMSQLMKDIAHACCTALIKHLDELKKEGRVKLGLRINLTRDSIGYEVGSKGQSLPVTMLNNLDTFLVPVLHQTSEEGVIFEFIFNIIE